MNDVQAALNDLQIRVANLERLVAGGATTESSPTTAKETAVAPWKYLVRRNHPWRQQLYVKGRNMTARQLVGSMLSEGRSVEETAVDFDLCVEAVREAAVYVDQNSELIAAEIRMERERLPSR